MKLWEIKAQALRLMFADADIEFSYTEFAEETVYNNANTREKLVRMEDSIRRAIDIYHQYSEKITKTTSLLLKTTESEGVITYLNELDLSGISDFGKPTRIDLLPDYSYGVREKEQLSFDWDVNNDKIILRNLNYANYEEHASFLLYYKVVDLNLPYDNDINELVYDLDTLNIPPEIQRHIPLFIKSELFEEDEAGIATQSHSKFINFLVDNQRKTFSKKQSKVKRTFPWNSDL